MKKTIEAVRRAATRAQYAEDQRLLTALADDIERGAAAVDEVRDIERAPEAPTRAFNIGGTRTEG